MEEDPGDIWTLPSGIHIGWRLKSHTPIVCIICLNILGKKPQEFSNIDEFVRHLNREHRFYFWKPKIYI